MVRICDDPDESKGICFLGGGCRGKGTGRREVQILAKDFAATGGTSPVRERGKFE